MLFPEHAARFGGGAFMVVTEQMQESVRQQQAHLVCH
jgi:hypothetical protein